MLLISFILQNTVYLVNDIFFSNTTCNQGLGITYQAPSRDIKRQISHPLITCRKGVTAPCSFTLP